jgi:hypothetical protein
MEAIAEFFGVQYTTTLPSVARLVGRRERRMSDVIVQDLTLNPLTLNPSTQARLGMRRPLASKHDRPGQNTAAAHRGGQPASPLLCSWLEKIGDFGAADGSKAAERWTIAMEQAHLPCRRGTGILAPTDIGRG